MWADLVLLLLPLLGSSGLELCVCVSACVRACVYVCVCGTCIAAALAACSAASSPSSTDTLSLSRCDDWLSAAAALACSGTQAHTKKHP